MGGAPECWDEPSGRFGGAVRRAEAGGARERGAAPSGDSEELWQDSR